MGVSLIQGTRLEMKTGSCSERMHQCEDGIHFCICGPSALRKVWLMFACMVLCMSSLQAGLTREHIEQVYGKNGEWLTSVPGRPWVEAFYRVQVEGLTVNAYVIGGQVLWIDYHFLPGVEPTEQRVFEEMEKVLPGVKWEAREFHGRPRWWFNANEDRITLRASGFSLHMNDFIRNVLSRRQQWQF
jgi:hypothetical protein